MSERVFLDDFNAIPSDEPPVTETGVSSRNGARRGEVLPESVPARSPASRDPSEKRATDPPEPLPFALLSSALANAPDEPLWTWGGYLAPGALTLLAGRPKVGKSTLAFGLLKQIAAGEPFLERSTRAAGALLLSEEREGTLAEKARRFNLNGRVHLLMRHQAHGRPWPHVAAAAVAYCREHDLGLLVVDTLDKWTGLRGDAENNAGSVLETLEPLTQAAAAGLTILIVAHQRKSLGAYGEAVRGSNALTGGVDVVVELERPSSDVLAGEGVRQLLAQSRYSSTPEELVVALTEDGYEARGDTLTAHAEAERQQLLDVLEALGEATVKKLQEETEIAESTIRRHLKHLREVVDPPLVDRRQGSGSSHAHAYFLARFSTESLLASERTSAEWAAVEAELPATPDG